MVYFIADSENKYIKIGYTIDIQERLKGLQTSSPLTLYLYKIIPGNTIDEKTLHKEFKEYHLRNEWFNFTNELKDKIDNLNSDRFITEFDKILNYILKDICTTSGNKKGSYHIIYSHIEYLMNILNIKTIAKLDNLLNKFSGKFNHNRIRRESKIDHRARLSGGFSIYNMDNVSIIYKTREEIKQLALEDYFKIKTNE